MPEVKVCTRCKVGQPPDAFAKDVSRRDGKHPYCRKCKRDDYRSYRVRPNAVAKKRAYAERWRNENRERFREMCRVKTRQYRASLRIRVLAAYGGENPTCACCGEDTVEFLAVDHINGGGNAHRREIKADFGWSFYKWLVDNDYPDGFQLLCHNCNFAKSHYGGVCPHQRKRAEVA